MKNSPGNKRILHLHKLTIDCQDKERMSEDEYAFMCLMSLAVDELSTLERLMLQALRGPPQDPLLRELQIQQAHTISRLLSGKIIETQRLVVSFEGRLRKGPDKYGVATFIKSYMDQLVQLRRDPLFKLTERIRHKLSNHYDLDVAKEVFEKRGRVSATAILHRMSGNAYFSFGERLLFGEIVAEFFRSRYQREMTVDDVDAWHDYELTWCRQLVDFFSDYIRWVHTTRFPEWRLTEWKPYLEPAFVGNVEDSTLPIFLEQ